MGPAGVRDQSDSQVNKNFWILLLPLHTLAVIGLFNLGYGWPWLLLFWFLFGVIGNGVAGHRYFAHNQFQCSVPMRYMLGVLATLGAYAPISYWRIQHLHHHAHPDSPQDVHSPDKGAFNTFYGWILTDENIQAVFKRNKVAIRVMKDGFYAGFFKHHYTIIGCFVLALSLIDYRLVCMYALAYVLDVLRLGAVNYFCHRSGYRLYDTPDHSKNNVWVGLLGLGFGWHNTHHAKPNQLILTERWWELDVEGYIGWTLSKL